METIAERNGLTLYLAQDEDAGNPRTEYENAGHMVCWHRRYNLGDKHNFSTPDNFREWWKENGKNGLLLNLYLYDHGGITMSCSPFSCPWDSGQVGYIYLTRAEIQKEWGKRKGNTEKARHYLLAEVETYDQFLTGEVYGYIIEDLDGEQVDSCWGFYGYEHARSEGLEMLASCVENERIKQGQGRLEAMESYR